MKKLTIAIDVDQTVAELHGPWIKWANARFGTNHKEFLSWDDPTDWWGNESLEFLTPKIYSDDTVLPIPGAIEGVNRIRAMGCKVVFATSCNRDPLIEAAKLKWLRRWDFLHNLEEFLPRVNKSGVEADVMADDGIHFLRQFKGLGVLIDASHNRHEDWTPRIKHIAELPKFLEIYWEDISQSQK